MELSAETLRFIEEHLHDDVRALALKGCKSPGVDLPAALTQIAGRQTALRKLPTWAANDGILYPPHLPLEQCSSEMTARYKALLVNGTTLTDLTGGFGIDCFFLSTRFSRTTYVERQEVLCRIATHNFARLGRPDITVCHADSRDYLSQMTPVDCIFIDPARRNTHGAKTVAIGDCEPDIRALEELLTQKASLVFVKLSPMLDIAQALRELSRVKAVHIVSVQNECKELLLLLAAERQPAEEVSLHGVNLIPRQGDSGEERPFSYTDFTFTPNEESRATCPYADTVGAYLYEPNASILKAGGYRITAQRFGLSKLHPNSHLYTADRLVESFPGRRFCVEQVWGFTKKELKEAAALAQANISVRNFPESPEALRKRLKLKDGGDLYLFATTLSDGRKVLIRCRKA